MGKYTVWLLSLGFVLGLVSTGYSDALVLGDFEGNLGDWRAADATLSFSPTGATVGVQALQVDGPGGWHIDALLDLKPNRTALANPGVKITADITAFEADMATTYMQVEMVINAQNNDDAGVHNNIGWNGLGLQDIVRDGQPHSYTWVLPESLIGALAGTDDTIGWLELALVSNLESTTVTKFYIDNIQLSYDAPTSNVVIGNFEDGALDNWGPGWEDNTAVEVSTLGVTSGSGSLAVTKTDGYWGIQWGAPSVPETLAETRLQFDLTMIASEWPVSHWTQVANSVALNSNGTSGWKEFAATAVDTLTGADTSLDWGRWTEDAPDVVKTYTVDISDYDLTDATWFQIIITIQGGDGQGHFYFDNIKLVGPAEEETPKSTDTVIANWEQEMDGWVEGGGAGILFNDTNGVTLDNYSLDIWVPNGDWNTDVLVMNLLEPNNAPILEAFKINTKISVDVTRLVADWPDDDIPGWNEILMVINAGGDGWSMWELLGKQASWNQNNGDMTETATWDYAPYLSRMDFDNITWCELHLGINANDPEYEGWVLFYLDNMMLTGGGVPLDPHPANAAENVNVETLLTWQSGLFASTHELYLGTDAIKVAGADMDSDSEVLYASLEASSFDPDGLEFDTRYFWRVVEVNDVNNPDSPWAGPVWSFTTANYIIVDDFESYGNDAMAMEQVYQTWIDGLGYLDPAPGLDGNGSGSVLGYDPAIGDVMEKATVHGGAQSVSMIYRNDEEPFVSEIIRTFEGPQDWTIRGFNALRLSVYGTASNTADQVYVTVEDADGNVATVIYGTPEALTTEAWSTLENPLVDFTAQGVNLAAVAKMTVGVGSRTNPMKGSGTVLLDDIDVCFRPVGLVAHYAFEDNLEDSSGNGHDGALGGDPNFPVSYVAGAPGLGTALALDGTDGHEYVDLGTFNPSAATGELSLALWVKWNGPSGSWQGLMGKRQSGDWDAELMMWYFELETDVWDVRFARAGSSLNTEYLLPVDQWTHLVVTFDGATAKVYANGQVVGEGAFSFGMDKEAPMQIGASVAGGGNPFNGTLDDVRIYDSVLSDAEILELAN